MASIERLHRHQIYPIVLLIKFKDRTQIKEVKDSRYPSDKISTKAAKEMFEQSLKIEAEYKQYISGKQIVFLILFVCIREMYTWFIYTLLCYCAVYREQISLINMFYVRLYSQYLLFFFFNFDLGYVLLIYCNTMLVNYDID